MCTISARLPTRSDFRNALAGAGPAILRCRTGENRTTNDFAYSVVQGLASRPYRLDCRFLYDARGSALFNMITQQQEYYLTGTEANILAHNCTRIRDITGPVALVELGSGSSDKTDYLLRAWLARAPSACYIPVDVSDSALRGACQSIADTHPAVRVTGLNADYRGAFPFLKEVSPAMAVFLGSSIGNFDRAELSDFLTTLATALSPGDFFLVGVDLVKEHSIIEAAYNDAAGVTSDFTRNIFARMNRELDSGIDLSVIQHVARYNPMRTQVEISARFTRRQTIRVAPLGRTFELAEGEMVRTEISRKFRLTEFIPYVERAGFLTEQVFTDVNDWFALLLFRRSSSLPAKVEAGNT